MRTRPLAALAAFILGIGTVAIAAPAAAATGNFSDTPAAAPLVIDDETVSRQIPVTLDGTIADIDVTLDFRKVGDWCSNPSGFLAWNNEIDFDLIAPSGTRVTLIKSGHLSDDPEESDPDITYPSPWESEHVEVVLDDQATVQVGNPERDDPNDRYPESGVFHTAGLVLDSLVGEPAQGDWTLEITNASWGDQLCYYGATLDIETVETIPAPALSGGALPAGSVGEDYSERLGGTTAGPIDSYAAADPSKLPPGLELVAATGEITGVPTARGDYSFAVAATGPGGASAPATFTISIGIGAVHALSISPAAAAVDQGGSLEFAVAAFDIEGNAVDVAGEYALSSSVATDRIIGDRVAFPHASRHTITATHLPTGLTASSTVEVRPTTQPAPSPSKPEEIARTGSRNPAAAWSIASALLALGAATAALRLRRRA